MNNTTKILRESYQELETLINGLENHKTIMERMLIKEQSATAVVGKAVPSSGVLLAECEWTETTDKQGYYSWDIKCGFNYDSGDNPEFKYCPYCAKLIKRIYSK